MPARDHHLLAGLDPGDQLGEAGLGLADVDGESNRDPGY